MRHEVGFTFPPPKTRISWIGPLWAAWKKEASKIGRIATWFPNLKILDPFVVQILVISLLRINTKFGKC